MSLKTQLWLAAVGAMLLPQSVPALQTRQAPAHSAKRPASVADATRASRGIEILESLVDAAREIPDKSERFRMMTNVADALWPVDAAGAERLAERTFEESADIDTSERASYGADRSRYIRSELVSTVRRHNPALAVKFAKNLDVGLPPSNESETDPYYRLYPLLEQARLLASDDPTAAAALVRQILAAGIVPSDIDMILDMIAEQNRPLSTALCLQALDTVESARENPLVLESFALPGWSVNYPDNLDEQRCDPAVVRRYVEVEFEYLKPDGNGSVRPDQDIARNNYINARALLLLSGRFAPELVGEVQSLVSQLRTALDADVAATLDAWLAGDRAEVMRRLEESGSASDEGIDADMAEERDDNLVSVAEEARSRGDTTKAREIAVRIREPRERDEVLARIIETEMQAAEAAGRYADVTRLASEITDRAVRANVLASLAEMQIHRGRRTRAIQLFDDAYRLLTSEGTMLPVGGVSILLAYAKAVLTITPERSFELVRDAISAANRSDPQYCCRGAGTLSSTTDFSEVFAKLAVVDLERAVGLAKSIDDRYNSISALIAIGITAAVPELEHDVKSRKP